MKRDQRSYGQDARGLTLIEVVMSMAVMSIVMVAMGSTLLLASKAIPGDDDQSTGVIEPSRVATTIGDELRTAIYMTERKLNAVTFAVADRNNDGIPEVIRYAWSGETGDPLTRQYNGATPLTVLPDVQQFDLTYTLRADVETYPGPLIEGPEIELSSHPSVAGSEQTEKLKSDEWFGQYFNPTLQAGSSSWQVTRVKFMAKKDGPTNGETRVQLRTADANNLPTDTVLEERTMYESNLDDNYAWQQFTFNDTSGLAPGQGLCLVLEWIKDGKAAGIRHDEAGGGSGAVDTDDGGDTWVYDGDEAMLHYVYGKVIAPGPSQTATRQYVTAVGMTLQTGAASSAPLQSTVNTLNLPEALSAVWELDFNVNPLQVDLNGDGLDWRHSDGGSDPFGPGNLANGIWRPDGNLDTNPDANFDELTTVDLRFRDTASDGGAGAVKLRIDRTGNTYGFIHAEIEMDGSGTQTLQLKTYDTALDLLTVATVSGLGADFVDLRIVVDPVLDTVNFQVNGQDQGTYQYGRITASTVHVIRLYETESISGVQFDHLRIRVGGNP